MINVCWSEFKPLLYIMRLGFSHIRQLIHIRTYCYVNLIIQSINLWLMSVEANSSLFYILWGLDLVTYVNWSISGRIVMSVLLLTALTYSSTMINVCWNEFKPPLYILVVVRLGFSHIRQLIHIINLLFDYNKPHLLPESICFMSFPSGSIWWWIMTCFLLACGFSPPRFESPLCDVPVGYYLYYVSSTLFIAQTNDKVWLSFHYLSPVAIPSLVGCLWNSIFGGFGGSGSVHRI